MAKNNVSSKSASGAAVSGATNLAAGLARIAALVFLARMLTPQDFGVFAAAMVFISVPQQYLFNGLTYVTIQISELCQHLYSAVRISGVVMGVFLCALIVVSADPLSSLVGVPKVRDVLPIVSIAFVIFGLGKPARALLLRELRFELVASIELISEILGFVCVALVLAWWEWGVWSLVWATLAQLSIEYLSYLVMTTGKITLAVPSRQNFRKVFTHGLPASGSAVADGIRSAGEEIVVSRTLGAEALGFYSRAKTLPQSSVGRFQKVFSRVALSAFASVQHEPARIRRGWNQTLSASLLLTLPACLFLATFSNEIVAVVLGNQWDRAAPILSILSVAAALNLLTFIHLRVLLGIGDARAVFLLSWMRTALVLGGATLGGVVGGELPLVAYGVLAGSVLMHIVVAARTMRMVGLSVRQYIRGYIPPVLFCVGVVAPIGMAMAVTPPLSVYSTLGLATVASAITVGLLLRVFPIFFLGDLMDTMQRFAGKRSKSRGGPFFRACLRGLVGQKALNEVTSEYRAI